MAGVQVDYYFLVSIGRGPYIGHKPFSDLVSTYDLKVKSQGRWCWSICSRRTGGLPLMKRHPVAASATGWSSLQRFGATSAASNSIFTPRTGRFNARTRRRAGPWDSRQIEGRSRPRSIFAGEAFCRRVGGSAQSGRSRRDRENWPDEIRASRQTIGCSDRGSEGDQRGL